MGLPGRSFVTVGFGGRPVKVRLCGGMALTAFAAACVVYFGPVVVFIIAEEVVEVTRRYVQQREPILFLVGKGANGTCV